MIKLLINQDFITGTSNSPFVISGNNLCGKLITDAGGYEQMLLQDTNCFEEVVVVSQYRISAKGVNVVKNINEALKEPNLNTYVTGELAFINEVIPFASRIYICGKSSIRKSNIASKFSNFKIDEWGQKVSDNCLVRRENLSPADDEYLKLLNHILQNGADKTDRTGVGTKSVFGYQMRFDLNKGFSLLTTKKLHLKSIIHELLWFINGDTNTKYLKDNGVTIWDEWADENGDLGPVYGEQWRRWQNPDGTTIDQLSDVIQMIRKNPDSRRMIVSAWHASFINKMKLPPCHCLFQFYVANGKLSCQLYQRSCDVFLGVPFNIASYALLTMMIAQVCNLKLGEFVHTLGDTHIYNNHFEQARLQLTRQPIATPRMLINPEVKEITDFKYEDFILENYTAWPSIKADIAV